MHLDMNDITAAKEKAFACTDGESLQDGLHQCVCVPAPC